jgi:hypothetical protein
MENGLRRHLEDLVDRLRGHGPDDPRAHRLEADVSGALASGQHEGLVDRLEEGAVEFENDHPDLAGALRQAIDALSAGGF